MDSLRILVPVHVLPNETHFTTKLIENLLPALEKYVNVHIIWLVFVPWKISSSDNDVNNSTMLDIHDFDNAVEIIQKIKPDIILDSEYLNIVDLACNIAGKYLDIPVITSIFQFFETSTTFSKRFRSVVSGFFKNYVYSSNTVPSKQVRQGQFHLYKMFFLLKTLFATKISINKMIDFFYLILKISFGTRLLITSKYPTDLIRIDGEILVHPLTVAGFQRESIVVTGNLMYDKLFKLKNFVGTSNKKNKLRILFLPIQLYEEGLWTKKQVITSIREIVTKILENKNEMSLIIKIHPTSQSLPDYESIIHEIDSSIPVLQTEDIVDLLNQSDVVVSFPSDSTALVYAILANKPIILCNFFAQERSPFLKRDLALECKEPSNLVNLIHEVLISNPATKKVDEFIREYIYRFDGLAAQRFAESIMMLLHKKYPDKW